MYSKEYDDGGCALLASVIVPFWATSPFDRISRFVLYGATRELRIQAGSDRRTKTWKFFAPPAFEIVVYQINFPLQLE